jgi:hypothetical protein
MIFFAKNAYESNENIENFHECENRCESIVAKTKIYAKILAKTKIVANTFAKKNILAKTLNFGKNLFW